VLTALHTKAHEVLMLRIPLPDGIDSLVKFRNWQIGIAPKTGRDRSIETSLYNVFLGLYEGERDLGVRGNRVLDVIVHGQGLIPAGFFEAGWDEFQVTHAITFNGDTHAVRWEDASERICQKRLLLRREHAKNTRCPCLHSNTTGTAPGNHEVVEGPELGVPQVDFEPVKGCSRVIVSSLHNLLAEDVGVRPRYIPRVRIARAVEDVQYGVLTVWVGWVAAIEDPNLILGVCIRCAQVQICRCPVPASPAALEIDQHAVCSPTKDLEAVVRAVTEYTAR